MADPRFYDNRGPVTLAELCRILELSPPKGADMSAKIFDVAGLAEAGPLHLCFCDGKRAEKDLAQTKAGWCFVGGSDEGLNAPRGTVLISAPNAGQAFATAARLFYAADEYAIEAQASAVHPSVKLGKNVVIAPGAVIGAQAEIGDRTRIGATAIIGRGVTIGRDSEIAPNAWVCFAHLGDEVLIGSGARVGGPGFGFASGKTGHLKQPQLGRVIVQDRVEVGANTTIDRGALGDTVIGEGTKIDNLCQIGHNTVIGRHCILVAQVGLSGSVVLGDFVVLGGQVGVADHVTIGDGARIAARCGVPKSVPGGQDYGGFPARPIRQWHREVAALTLLAKNRERSKK